MTRRTTNLNSNLGRSLGLGLVLVVLVVIVIVIIRQHPTTTSSNQVPDNWLSYKLSSSSLSFKYPRDWKISQTSASAAIDSVEFSGPSDFIFSLGLDSYIPPAIHNPIVNIKPMEFLGHSDYLAFVGSDPYALNVVEATIVTNPNDLSSAPAYSHHPVRYLNIDFGYGLSKTVSLKDIASDPNFKSAETVVGSMQN